MHGQQNIKKWNFDSIKMHDTNVKKKYLCSLISNILVYN